MKIFIRTDASAKIGHGHVMRCLSLAQALRDDGADIRFLCREIPNQLEKLIRKNHRAHMLPAGYNEFDSAKDARSTLSVINEENGCDWVVVDRNGTDLTWDKIVRRGCERVLLMDDLADKKRDCDILLNQNYLPDVRDWYEKLIPPSCALMLGPRYALLGKKFGEVRRHGMIHEKTMRNILISFGGGDNFLATNKALEAVRLLDAENVLIDVVANLEVDDEKTIAKLTEDMPNVTFHRAVDDMAGITAKADLTVGAMGVSTWERMCVGTPSIILSVAENQVKPSKALSAEGYVLYLGEIGGVSAKTLADAIAELLSDGARAKQMSLRGMELVDGLGAKRVSAAMLDVHAAAP